jgi:hypothetical protein
MRRKMTMMMLKQALPWYLTGGIAPADVVVAYKPIGAASLAASLTNLAHPGTNNADYVTPPTWSAANGWVFNGVDQYIHTAIQPTSAWSVLCRYKDANNNSGTLFGILNGLTLPYPRFYFIPINAEIHHAYGMGTDELIIDSTKLSGIVGISQYQGYFNGLADGTPLSGAWTDPGDGLTFLIGCVDIAGDSPYNFLACKIQGLALYNKTLSAAQMLAITTKMAALS